MREDWVQVEIENILQKLENGKEINQGWSPQCKSYPSPSDDIWGVLKTTAIQKNDFWSHENKELPKDKEVRSHLEVKAGDILLTCAGPRNRCGVACTVLKTRPRLLLSGKMYRFRPNERVMSTEFLTLFLQTQESWLAIDKMKTGTSDSGLNLTHARFRKLPIRIAPLPEQRAIVAKIEELFAALDKGIADLKKAQDQLKVYRQAVLKKAFEGELTKEWREQQTNLPTAEELLEQIKQERQKHYDQQLEDWKEAVTAWEQNGKDGKKPGKPRPLTIPDPPNAGHEERKWDIPKNWIWTQIGNLCFVTKLAGFEYTDYVTYADDGDLPVLKAENAGPNGFKKTNYSKVRSEAVKMLTRSQIFGGELLVVFVGAGTGNVAMVPLDKRFFLGPNIGMARPYFNFDSKYLELFLQSAFGKNLMMSALKAVAQPSLSMGTIRQAPVAFPSVEEQHQIVKEIESRLSVCHQVEQSLTESLEKAQALRQSILKKAFEGTLLNAAELAACKSAPDYEPASVLLERIKKEKG